jgi:nicotinamidase-related amidase
LVTNIVTVAKTAMLYKMPVVLSTVNMTALWTEACLTFPALDAMSEGFEVYPVIDAVGGTSLKAHDAALVRIQQAGAKPISWVQLLCELQRDWNREETSGKFAQLLFAVEGH